MILKTEETLYNGEGKMTSLLERERKYFVGVKNKKKQSRKLRRSTEMKLESNAKNPPNREKRYVVQKTKLSLLKSLMGLWTLVLLFPCPQHIRSRVLLCVDGWRYRSE